MTTSDKALATTMSPARQQALAKLPPAKLPGPLTAQEVAGLIEANFRDDAPDFVRVKFPTGGGASYVIPGASGDQATPTITGAIIHYHTARAYWPGAFSGGRPPECSSIDGKRGTVHGACDVCRFNQFGSGIRQDGAKAAGKACKEIVRIYLLQPGEVFPVLLPLPPSSLGAWKEHRTKLLKDLLEPEQVLVQFGLRQDRTGDGIVYSVATMQVVGALDVEGRERVATMRQALQGSFAKVAVGEGDYVVPPPVASDAPATTAKKPEDGAPMPPPFEIVSFPVRLDATPDMIYRPDGTAYVEVHATGLPDATKSGPEAMARGPICLAAKGDQAVGLNNRKAGDVLHVEGPFLPGKRDKAGLRLFNVRSHMYLPPPPAAAPVVEDDLPF